MLGFRQLFSRQFISLHMLGFSVKQLQMLGSKLFFSWQFILLQMLGWDVRFRVSQFNELQMLGVGVHLFQT